MVRHNQHGQAALARQLGSQLNHFTSTPPVQCHGGLIGQQLIRITHQRVGDRNPLTLAARYTRRSQTQGMIGPGGPPSIRRVSAEVI